MVTALRLLNTESQDKADYLHNQLITNAKCTEEYILGVCRVLPKRCRDI